MGLASTRVLKSFAVTLPVVSVLLFLASYLEWLPWPAGESGHRATDRVALERTARRTLQESQAEVDFRVPPAGTTDQVSDRTIPPSGARSRLGADTVEPPAGYSFGDHRGLMQRTPRTSFNEFELYPNPNWLESQPTTIMGALLSQAAQFDRDFTFAVLRVLPGTDLQALNRSLLALNAEIVGASGEYVRVNVPAEQRRLEAIAGLPGVLGIGAVPPEHKADESFVREVLFGPAGQVLPVFISLMAPDPVGQWQEALTELGVVVGAYDGDLHSYTANMPPGALERLLSADFVLAVEPVPAVRSNHASAVPAMGVDGLRSYDASSRDFSGITGAGIAVGVLDTGLNINHMDIVHGRDSVCGENFHPDENWDLWLDLNGHGTHVFGTIAGAGRTNPLLAGMAPELSHLRFGKVLSAQGWGTGDDIRRGMDYLSRPSSCAWQGSIPDAVKPLIVNMSLSATGLRFSGRGVGERKLDSVVHAHSQLYVVAQSNSGLHGFSNYGTAKNSLAVGAINDSGILAGFSSHGPTADGRLAPNVVATGVGLTSARGGGQVSAHNTFSGTSMAAPSVAGVAALLMQARPEFRNQPALARARLMASAIRPQAYLDSDTQFPANNRKGPGEFNNLYGLGLVSARTSLYSRDEPEGWLIGSAISQPDNENYEYVDIEVPRGASRLDVVLTWDEQPADTLTRSVLNDLDLWADRGANCISEACGEYASRSRIDNVEWLLIEDPVPGKYRIKVVPVEVYGETNTAAVAWKILRGEATPVLGLAVEDVSRDDDSEYMNVEVTIDASDYVASGTTLHLGCRTVSGSCWSLGRRAYLPGLSRVYREDGLDRSESGSSIQQTIPIGEIASGAPERVRFAFLREKIPAGSALHVTASSWNGRAASQSFTLSEDENEPLGDIDVPANDHFSTSKKLQGAAGETPLDFALASREPGEPLVSADSRTLWYSWRAPAKGLFRFKLRDADSGEAHEAEFALFTGARLVDLELETEKEGSEISFAAQAVVDYRLRISSDDWDAPALILEWESADARPVNDDFAFAQVLEGESGEVDSSNEGATLEGSEFYGGAAATVWFEWTAPEDGPWKFELEDWGQSLRVFEGARVDQLRLLSHPGNSNVAFFTAEQGRTYRLAVASRSADDSDRSFKLSWNSMSSDEVSDYFEDVDHFADAIRFNGAQGSISVSGRQRFHGLTVEPDEPLSTGIGTAWLQWTAPSTGRFTWQMDGHSTLLLGVFTGDSLSSLQLVGSSPGGSKFAFDARRDIRYWIAVGQSPAFVKESSPEAFTIHWGPTPVNDRRTAASRISGAGGFAVASLAHATVSPQDPTDTIGTDSVWWRWRAPSSGWHRFRLGEHPLSVILSIYPGDGSNRAVATSERSFIANGRVETFVLARAGQSYDILLASRPGVETATTAALRWERSSAPAFLSYKGAVPTDSLMLDGSPQTLRSPQHLALNSDGEFLASTADNGIFVFRRDEGTDELTLAYRNETNATNGQLGSWFLENAQLWWNARQSRLFAMVAGEGYGFAFSEDGSSVISQERISGYPGERISSHSGQKRGVGSLDGRFFFATFRRMGVWVYRVDSPAEFALEQIVSSSVDSDLEVEMLHVDNMRAPLDAQLSLDGSHLYVLAETGLFVFAVDSDSGKLDLRREILLAGGPRGPFQALSGFRRITIDSQGDVLFVAGLQSDSPANSLSNFPFIDNPIVAFDISADPSDPRHLDTLTGIHAELNYDVYASWSHLKPRRGFFERLLGCNSIVPHADLPAVDIFCGNGYYVAHWNRDTATLEVADFAIVGERDRFGGTLPDRLGTTWTGNERYRQMAQSPDGGRVYRTTNARLDSTIDAIHVFERASAEGFSPDSVLQETGGPSPGPVNNSPGNGGHGSLCAAAVTAGDHSNCPGYLGAARTDNSTSQAHFIGYASADQGASPHTEFAPEEEIRIFGVVFPAPSDQGKPGAVHVAAVMPNGDTFVRSAAGDWLPWDGRALPAAWSWEELPANMDLIVFGRGIPGSDTDEDSLPVTGSSLGITEGVIRFYIAYSTLDDDGVHHYSANPVTLTITNSGILD